MVDDGVLDALQIGERVRLLGVQHRVKLRLEAADNRYDSVADFGRVLAPGDVRLSHFAPQRDEAMLLHGGRVDAILGEVRDSRARVFSLAHLQLFGLRAQ